MKTINVQVADGPTLQTTQTLGVEAYESYEVLLLPGQTVNVMVLPDGVEGQVKLFLMQSTLYSSSSETITYSIDDKVTDRTLDAPQLFLGSGAIDELGPPQKITFVSDYAAQQEVKDKDGNAVKDEEGKPKTEDVTKQNTAKVTILVGRDATAEPAAA